MRDIELVVHLLKSFEDEKGKLSSFKELIDDCIYLKGIRTAEFLFNSLKNGWIENNYPKQNFKIIYNNIFGNSRDYYYSEIEQYLKEESMAELEFSYKDNPTIDEIEESVGIKSYDNNLWSEVEERFKYDCPVQVYVLGTKDESYLVNMIIPDYGVPISDYKKFPGKIGILPVKSLFKNIRNTHNDVIKSYVGKVINTRIIFLDKNIDRVILEPLKKV